MTCGCLDEFSDPRFCGRCRNGGKPLPPYRPVTEGEEEWGTLIPLRTEVSPRPALSGIDGSELIGIADSGFACVCGREVIAGDDVWRSELGEAWRGLACCPRPTFIKDPELVISD